MRGVEIVAADHDDRHPVAPGVVDRHGGVLQADRAVAQRHQRLAGDLEVAVRHADGGFLVHAGEEFRHLVVAVVDQQLVQRAETRGAVRRAVLDVERLDDVDHEVGAGHRRRSASPTVPSAFRSRPPRHASWAAARMAAARSPHWAMSPPLRRSQPAVLPRLPHLPPQHWPGTCAGSHQDADRFASWSSPLIVAFGGPDGAPGA